MASSPKKIRNSLDPSLDPGISLFSPSRTKQSHKDECDINQIIQKFAKNGTLPDLIKANPQYGDFSNIPDYQTSLNLVAKAQSQFAALPSKTRARFDNDPAKFLAFASDPSSGRELVSMGLAIERPAPAVPPSASAPQKLGKSTPGTSGGTSGPPASSP